MPAGRMQEEYEGTGIFDGTTGARLQISDPARVIAGRYEIIERIGGGGMGQVVRARHLRLEKQFAIKLMLPEFTQQPEAQEIFLREATLASRLSHPSVVSVVDFGEDPDWGPFIVMEFVEGEALSKRIQRDGALPLKVACDVAEQLVRAMRHTHENDVVHGDIKAENVACLPEAPGDHRHWTICLVDFGMANLASTAQREGRIAGTPAYIAPERITGGRPAPSADIYAFGVLMYEMLSGQLPFQHDDPETLLRMHLTDTPRPIAEVRGDSLDDELVALVTRAMARDPEARYQTAGDIATDLASYMRSKGLPQRHRGRRMPTVGGADRSNAALSVFNSLGVAAAGLNVDGIIVIANERMARFLGKEHPEELEGANLFDTSLGKVSTLRDDVRIVALDGKRVRRRFNVTGKGEDPVEFRLLLKPTTSEAVACTLALHRLK
jgi:serine/threonine protein kinase